MVEIKKTHKKSSTSRGGNPQNELNRQLLNACKSSSLDYDKVLALLEQGVSPNEPGYDGNTPLITAIISDHPHNYPTEKFTNRVKIVKLLLEKGANVNTSKTDYVGRYTTYNCTPLNYAISNIMYDIENYIKIIKILLENGADPNVLSTTDDLGSKPFATSLTSVILNLYRHPKTAALKLPELVKLLLDYGADPNIPNYHQYPLQYAALELNLEVCQLLLDHGAAKTINEYHSNYTLIGTFFKSYDANKSHKVAEMLKLLMKYGIDINNTQYLDIPPIINALNHNNNGALDESIKILLDNIPNLSVKNRMGSTPLIIASNNGQIDIVRYILNHPKFNKSDIDMQDFNGDTALIIAASRINIELVRLLLEHGANPNIANNQGYNALMISISIQQGYRITDRGTQLVELLLGRINPKSIYQRTNENIFGERRDMSALRIASANRNFAVILLLLTYYGRHKFAIDKKDAGIFRGHVLKHFRDLPLDANGNLNPQTQIYMNAFLENEKAKAMKDLIQFQLTATHHLKTYETKPGEKPSPTRVKKELMGLMQPMRDELAERIKNRTARFRTRIGTERPLNRTPSSGTSSLTSRSRSRPERTERQ